MMYNKLVETCFFSPKQVGILDLRQPLSAFYRGGQPGRGDVFELYLLCNNQGLILKACFKAYGNPYLIAASEWLCQQLQGTQINEHPHFDYSYLLSILEIPKSRYPVALQISDAYKEIVQLMKEKLKRGE